MNPRLLTLGVVAATLVLTGCATTPKASPATASPNTPTPNTAPAKVGTDGMDGMAGMDGKAMAIGTTRQSPQPSAPHPSRTTLMICGSDIRAKVELVLHLARAPRTTSTWVNHLYTCTYTLPMGRMVLSVKDSATRAEAVAYFHTQRSDQAPTETLLGLGQGAYGTPTGTVSVTKDNLTLNVDATALPAVFGANHQRRTDLAYEIASDVLGCWTGDS